MSKGSNFWSRAKKVIPGGNMLLSKRPEMFLPDYWPAYYSRAKGCEVWDLDGNRFIDLSIMGIGTNTLGYGCTEVDAAVQGAIGGGNMSTLNCPEEVLLAEKLVELHPWFDMVRFARSGGEANAIALRLARGASGKDVVAVCGYHGWHDWYLAANLSEKDGLSEHLLPGLSPVGVPANLRNSVKLFNYNDVNTLEEILSAGNVGVVMMEVQRSAHPDPGFLESVRVLADRYGAVLIFDECTSGFRGSFGGLHKVYNVVPDIAVFGKALGNGYAITAIVGKRAVMEVAQSSFISSTFWTERIGPTAGYATLQEMERIRSWQCISEVGRNIKKVWTEISEDTKVPIKVSGLDAIPSFSFCSDNPLLPKTFMTQEMLKLGYLAGPLIYASTAHDARTVSRYGEQLHGVFRELKGLQDNETLAESLDGDVCHSGFARLV